MMDTHYYVFIHRPDPNWLAGKPIAEQPLAGHFRYMSHLQSRQKLVLERLFFLFVLTILFNAACNLRGPISPSSSSPTPTVEQAVVAAVSAKFESDFYASRDDCIQAVAEETTNWCRFPLASELTYQPEWEQLFPNTLFYLVDIGLWRSEEDTLPGHQQEETHRFVAAWQAEEVYMVQGFGELLDANAISVTDANRELVAQSFALMSIPAYLGGGVRFLEWSAIEPVSGRHKYNYYLKGWTEIWGCQFTWLYVFTDQWLPVVTRTPINACASGDYVENYKYFGLADEGILVSPHAYLEDFYFNR